VKDLKQGGKCMDDDKGRKLSWIERMVMQPSEIRKICSEQQRWFSSTRNEENHRVIHVFKIMT
jgi:hypothetical protein